MTGCARKVAILTRPAGPVRLWFAGTVIVTVLTAGCEQKRSLPKTPPNPAKPAPSTPPTPKRSPATTPPSPRSDAGVTALQKRNQRRAERSGAFGALGLFGIDGKAPAEWAAESPKVNPRMPQLAPKLQYRLARADGDPDDVVVQITHFPAMKGKDQANLTRWYAMFTQPDGRPTKDVATVTTTESDGVKLTVVDITGTMVSARPRNRSEPQENYRMVAAIIDHPRGPHFLKAIGPHTSVAKWRDSIDAFLNSVHCLE